MGKPEYDDKGALSDPHGAPPYTEAIPRGGSSHPGEAPPDYHAAVATGASRVATPYRPFPPVLHARYQWKITQTFHLCSEHPDEKLYAVAAHSGFSGNLPRVVLHNGPSDKDPFLAAACEERSAGFVDTYSLNSIIQLPPAPAVGSEELVTEVMHARTVGQDGVGFVFSIEVNHDGKLVREEFEWRKSKKGSDEELGKEGGFKLLRLSSRQHLGSSAASSSHDIAIEDGCEVLALFKWNKTLTNMMHPFELRFVGAGLSGSLGDRWAVMTVITGLRLWWLHAGGRANRRTAAVGEGGASSTAYTSG